MTKQKAQALTHWINAMQRLGFTFDEAYQLRRIEMTLHRWSEKECGDGNGCICRDDETEKPYWLNSTSGAHYPIADRENGALRRLRSIMARHPELWFYQQGDPRGCALYVGSAEQLMGMPIEQAYSRGICCNY